MSVTAKKLPSGTWRCQVHDYTDADGKKHRISFSGPTKAIAEAKAAEYIEGKNRKGQSINLTVSEAISRYIEVKESVLSPSTIINYMRMRDKYYGSIGKKKIYSLGNADLQLFVSNLVGSGVSAKTVRNIYGLLISAVTMFMPEAVFRVALPKRGKITYSVPDDNDVRRLVKEAKYPLNLAILLGVCGMRRGEICAIKYGDVNRATRSIYVHADMVLTPSRKHEYKPTPKTSHSVRMVPVSQDIIDLIGEGEPDAFVFPYTPDYITKHFCNLRNSLGMSCRFHDLRHYYATVMSSMMPRAYIEEFGGWSPGSRVLDSVYTNTLDSKRVTYQRKTEKHIKKISHEISHEAV